MLVELADVCRDPEREDPLEAPRMVPSTVHLVERPGLLDRVGSWPPLARRVFLGQRALIGRPALERNREVAHPAFVPTFKAALSSESTRPLARLGRRAVTAREVAELFLRELLVSVKRATGERIRDLVVTAPVSAFETYRAEVQRILHRLGVRRVRFVDEPVAAALGYGLSLSHERTVLVVDIGGGTMHVVLVALSPRGAMGGEARVLAKQGRPLGGNAVDGWILEEACGLAGYPPLEAEGDENARFWRRLMLAEACRVKEAVHFDETAVFRVTPPGFGSGGRTKLLPADVHAGAAFRAARGQRLLPRARGLPRRDVRGREGPDRGRRRRAACRGLDLLPGVFSRLEQRFERRRMRAWQPFEAVAYGGACFAADRIGALDFIVHDYAFVTHDARTGEAQHTVIVRRGRASRPRPTSGSGSSCRPARSASRNRSSASSSARWRGGGHGAALRLRRVGGPAQVGGTSGKDQVIVPLNASAPTLGYLEPPHDPKDRGRGSRSRSA